MTKYFHEDEDSITIKELIDILKKYHGDLKVFCTWETCIIPLEKKNIYKSKEGNIFIDADDNNYKSNYAEKPKENNDE